MGRTKLLWVVLAVTLILVLSLGVLWGEDRAKARDSDLRNEDAYREALVRLEADLHEDRRQILAALGRMESALLLIGSEPVLEARTPATSGSAPGSSSDANVSRQLAELREAIERIERERTLHEVLALEYELGGGRATGPMITLADVAGMSREDLTRAVRWRSFEDVHAMLGAPARQLPQGTALVWEYDRADGGLLGVRFVNGRAIDAWD